MDTTATTPADPVDQTAMDLMELGADLPLIPRLPQRLRASSGDLYEKATFQRFDVGDGGYLSHAVAVAPSPAATPRSVKSPSDSPRPIELFYDSIADRFDDIMNLYDMRRRVETVFDVFLRDFNLTGRKVLDAGCGTGWFSLRASQRGADVTALDIGPRLLEQVRRKCPARTVCGSVTDLQFDDDTFDVVISSECIEHTRQPAVAVRELIRVCRPGGRVAITSNNHFWYWLCALANRLKLRPYEGIENWPRWSDLRSWVERENVHVIDQRGIHLFPFQIRLLHPILKFLDRFGRVSGPVCVNQAILALKQC
ncbi:MAG: class I SAM-dependent methyltransferase [Phycisphaerae bacterium]